tara:strand:- start:2376 stop:2630 length:255 start_codon:yes stop_codon:yes gene_type:complete
MKAINDYVVIKTIKEEKKVGGLLLTDTTDSDNRYKKAEVVSVGDQANIIKEGMIIMYDKHSGHDVRYEEVMYRVIKLRDIVLVE